MTQTTIHDYPLHELPPIFSSHDIDRILYSLKHPGKSRGGQAGYWIADRNATIFLMQYHLALRTKEVLCIKKSDIDFKAGLVRIDPMSNKLRKGRVIPLNDILIEQLKRYISISKLQYWNFGKYLFPSLKTDRLHEDQWQNIFRHTLVGIGMYHNRKTSPYTLRHTKATEIYEHTKNPIMVASILGHKTLESTKTYIHLASLRHGFLEEMRAALDNPF